MFPLFLPHVILIQEAVNAAKTTKARNDFITTLPKDQQDEIRAEDKRKAIEHLDHRKKLEIANAGRARNFWGK